MEGEGIVSIRVAFGDLWDADAWLVLNAGVIQNPIGQQDVPPCA